jgi:hypothetical protein
VETCNGKDRKEGLNLIARQNQGRQRINRVAMTFINDKPVCLVGNFFHYFIKNGKGGICMEENIPYKQKRSEMNRYYGVNNDGLNKHDLLVAS